jgi:hypothetical protein
MRVNVGRYGRMQGRVRVGSALCSCPSIAVTLPAPKPSPSSVFLRLCLGGETAGDCAIRGAIPALRNSV